MKRSLKKRIGTQSSNVYGGLKLLLTSFLMFLVVTSQMYANTSFEFKIQQQEIKGTVTGADNSPLPGVSILVVGTTNGTETDFDGNYSITANKGDVLQFSFVGMQTQTVTVGDDTTINVTLTEDASALDEIIVVGYGTKKKRDITSAVSQITAKQIEISVQASPEFALQGTTSGILVQSATGDPNARPTIRIRGVGTLGFNDPLYVIDGIPISEFGAGATALASGAGANDIRGSQNILNLINPSDIASISVLKDAAATAVYGMRASNGVILIETKRGKGDKTTFSVSARRGIRNIRKNYDVLNTSQYTSLLTDEYNNAGLALPGFIDPSDAAFLGNGQTYDWQSAVTNDNALTEDYSFSAQSGNEKANFYFSGAISNQESTLIYNKLKRYTATLTSDFKINKWLKIGETLRIAYSENDDSKGVVSDLNLIANAFKPAWQPIFDANDPTGFAPVRDAAGTLLWGDTNGGTGINHLAVGDIGFNQYNILRNLGSVYAEVSPLEGLIFKGTLGVDWNNNKRERIRSRRYFRFHVNSQDQTDYLIRDLTNFSILTEFLTSYTKEINDHNFNVLMNVSKQEIGTNWIQAGAINPLFEDRERVGLSPSDSQTGESFKERKILSGLLFKFSYNFNSKYYLDASYRRDGSSVFAPGNRFGDFYGVSGAWRLSDEAFMEDVSWLDDLKFRVSWGQTGNQETQAFSYLASISLNPRLATGNFDNSIILGAFQPGFPNPDLSWETSSTTNIGFDGSAFNRRLGFSFDYYYRLTEDILQPFPLPATIGINNSPVVNLAEVSNKGIELQFDWNDQIGDFEYNIGMNLTTITNKVEKLTDEAADGRIIQAGFYGTQVGSSIGFIYGYQMEGIFQTQAEVDAWRATHTDQVGSQADISPGDVQFADIFGVPDPGEFRSNTPDGLVDSNDRTILGKTIPGYFYGINMGAKYKQFDFSMQWQGVGDIQKVNQVRLAGEGQAGHANQLSTVLDRWTPTNPSNTIPRALRNDVVANNRFSSRFVEDADYLRLQNLQVGYTFDQKTLDKLGLQNLRLYVSGNNVAIITGYSGLDPEVNLFNEPDFNPPATSWLLGINLTF
jgi:TonB-linked SusC/RagA family outer membrane protein